MIYIEVSGELGILDGIFLEIDPYFIARIEVLETDLMVPVAINQKERGVFIIGKPGDGVLVVRIIECVGIDDEVEPTASQMHRSRPGAMTAFITSSSVDQAKLEITFSF